MAGFTPTHERGNPDAGARARRGGAACPGTPGVAARILAADLACLGHEVAAALRSGADRVHVDVMDLGRGSAAAGPEVCRALRRVARAPLDVHLLVKPDADLVAAYAAAGVDLVAIHPEACDDVARAVACVKAHGCGVGLALAAGSPLETACGLLDEVDVVFVTWAAPGLDGNRFMPSALRWIRSLRAHVSARGLDVGISVDGGVDEGSAAGLVEAGADALVVESAACGSADRAATIAALKGRGPLHLTT